MGYGPVCGLRDIFSGKSTSKVQSESVLRKYSYTGVNIFLIFAIEVATDGGIFVFLPPPYVSFSRS